MNRIFLIASGPSLEGFDFHKLDDQITLGINYIFRYYVPTILLWGDYRVYQENGHKEVIDKLDCIKVTKEGNMDQGSDVYLVRACNKFHGLDGLKKGLFPDMLTGQLAIALAIALRFNPIYLLGYDCGFRDGKTHFYQDFKHKGTDLRMESVYAGKDNIGLYNTFKDIDYIYNCTPDSNLKLFPYVPIDEVLSEKYQIDKEYIKSQVRQALGG